MIPRTTVSRSEANKQYLAGYLPDPGSIRRAFRKIGQKAGWSRASLFRRVAAAVHRDRDQANGEKASGGDHPQDGSRSA